MTIQINLTEAQEMALKNYATERNLTVEQMAQNKLIELLEDFEDLKTCEEFEKREARGEVELLTSEDFWRLVRNEAF